MVVVKTMKNLPRSGFTLIEVLASVLILSIGLIGTCALIMYGLSLVRVAHGKSLGLATAMTVLVDPSPLRTDVASYPDGALTSGYLNGLWVVRSESNAVNLDATGRLMAVTVAVDVFDSTNGRCLLSVNRRLIRDAAP